MLLRSLSEHAAGCFYGSELLASQLWIFLQQTANGDKTQRVKALQEICYQQLIESVDSRHPRRYRLNDISQLMNQLCDGDLFHTGRLPWLTKLFDQLMVRNGDLICYRETEVQAYARLTAELDPTLLVAWNLSQWLEESSNPTAKDIQRIVAAQDTFFAPPGNPVQPFAEGHVHIGGVTADSAILDEYLLANPASELPENKRSTPWHLQQTSQLNNLLERLRALLWLLLDGKSDNPTTCIDQQPQLDNCDARSHPWQEEWVNLVPQLSMPLQKARLPDWEMTTKIHAVNEVGSPGWLLSQFAVAMKCNLRGRWLWLQLYLCRCYRSPQATPQVRVAILCWYQSLNEFRRRLIMDGQGLTRFSKHYFNGPLGRGSKALRKDNIRQLLSVAGDVVEIKSHPGTFCADFAADFATTLAQETGFTLPDAPYIFGEHEIVPDAKVHNYMQQLERWQFCGHFSRSAMPQQRGRAPVANMKALWKSAIELMKKVDNTTAWNRPEFMMGYRNPHFHFQPARWFRGLDVAGDENDLRIEWFAPVLRWLRRGLISRPEGEYASAGFHLSIHAGEDYSHPLSGMRHIDETVRFCEMRDGDRLGHALALGIEPQWWMARQGEMILPADEHLDNLVWLWHYAVTLSGRLPLAQQVQSQLARRIARFFPESGWQTVPDFAGSRHSAPLKHESVNPEILFRAWLLRKNCHFRLMQLHGGTPLSTLEFSALPDFTFLKSPDPAAVLYANRHQHLSAASAQPLVIVRLGDERQAQSDHLAQGGKSTMGDSGMLEDIDTPAEVEFMHAVQDYLLDRYDRMGLIIETNPTSNIYIARLEKHREHPIFRWSPPDETLLAAGEVYNRFGLRRGPMRVLINTDDPGVMPTTLRTEFLLLREAAIESGISRTVAERWLEQIRQYGIEQFHRNHMPVFTPH